MTVTTALLILTVFILFINAIMQHRVNQNIINSLLQQTIINAAQAEVNANTIIFMEAVNK